MENVRLGIIGLGVQGAAYANFIDEGRVGRMTLGAICDVDESKKEQADKFGVPFYTDYLEMLDSDDIDAVVTTVPHYLHPEMGIEALKRHVPVLIEKPAGVYTKQVNRLFDFADQQKDVTFAIMFNQRTNQLYIDLRDLIKSGELGKLRHTSWIITNWWRPQPYYDQSEWRATWGGEGGGVLVNQAPHQLDLWQWMCGVPKRCFARLAFGFQRDIATEDEVNALVDFGEGATGHFMTCTNDLVGTDRLEILLDAGKIVVEDSSKVKIYRLKDNERTLSDNMPVEEMRKLFSMQMDPSEFFSVEEKEYGSVWGQQHCSVLENFADAILDGTELIADGRDGINGVRLANAMQLSAWTGEDIDMVNFPEDRYLEELNKRIAAEGKFPTRK